MRLPEEMRLVAEICARHGWTMTMLDSFSGYLARISDGRRSFLTGAGRICLYPLNSATACDVARDKAHTYALLAMAGFRVPEGRHFFLSPLYRNHRPPGRERRDAPAYARSLGYPVFIKPNDGARGAFAGEAYEDGQVLRHLDRMAGHHDMALVQEVIRQPEYRLFVVDGQVMFSYRRLPPALLGDGRSSVAELLEAANGDAIGDGVQPVTAESPFLQRQLAERGLSLDSVLADGETLRHSAPSNVAAGGAIAEYQETCRPEVAAWAARLAEACALRVCAVDLFAVHGLEDPAGFTVIEVNGNPSLMGLCATGRRAAALRIYETVAVKALG